MKLGRLLGSVRVCVNAYYGCRRIPDSNPSIHLSVNKKNKTESLDNPQTGTLNSLLYSAEVIADNVRSFFPLLGKLTD